MTPTETAEAMKLSKRTLARYLSNGGLQEALRELRRDRLQAITNTALDAARAALRTLAHIAGDEDAPASARVAAAGRIIENALRLNEAIDIEERIAKLEAALREDKEDSGGDEPAYLGDVAP